MKEFLRTLLWRPPPISRAVVVRASISWCCTTARLVTRAPSDGSNGAGRVCQRATWSARTGVRQRKWSTSPDNAWHACTFNRRSVGVEMGGFTSRGFDAPLRATCARVFAFFCYHLQIPVRHARAGVGPGIASHKELGPASGGHHDPSDDPSFMQRFIGLVRDEHRKGHFPKVWDPSRAQKACLLSPDTSSTVSPATSSALPLPDVHTIDGLQEALKMFGYRIALNSDYGAETRQVVAGFQMRTGIVADGVAGAQTEAKLLSELKRMRETDGHLQR